MRTMLLVLSVLVVVAGIVSANMWSSLRAERQLTADLQTQLIEAKMLLQVARSAGPPVAAVPPPVVTAAVPDSTRNSLPARAPLPRDEASKAQQKAAESSFAVNQSGQMQAKPSTIMTNNDLNKDGVVTKEEATTAGKALIRMWSAYDLNKDDVVDDAEIARASGL